MTISLLLITAWICLYFAGISAEEYRLPIIFAYTVVPAICQYGLPGYIKTSLEQAAFTQPDCDVILLTNLQECPQIKDSLGNDTNILIEDSVSISSARTKQFYNASLDLFMRDGHGELWITSALRFFMLEDLMASKKYKEMMHVEADNMLYGRMTTIVPVLREKYPIAVTPLNREKSFFTASVFWVSNSSVLHHFTEYLMDVAMNRDGFKDKYFTWLRYFACCKKGGYVPDANGMGIKPFAVNEMSMISYYHELHPQYLRLLPVVPTITYVSNRHSRNTEDYAFGGKETSPGTGMGIWDSNSWGQFIGGTSSKHGRDKGFVDGSHIIGMAIRSTTCRPKMMCGNFTEMQYAIRPDDSKYTSAAKTGRCYSAPIVHCPEAFTAGYELTPLWNLHVHSKHTQDFKSQICDCNTAVKL